MEEKIDKEEKLRNYHAQRDAQNIFSLKNTEEHSVRSLIMSIGAGKTNVANELFFRYIKKFFNEKTFQIFVCPTLKLITQQKKALNNYLKDIINNKYGIHTITDAEIARNLLHESLEIAEFSSQTKYNENDVSMSRVVNKHYEYIVGVQHMILFVCGDSLLVNMKDCKITREKFWNSVFKNNEKFNRKNGYLIFDEGHNYENYRNVINGNVTHEEN